MSILPAAGKCHILPPMFNRIRLATLFALIVLALLGVLLGRMSRLMPHSSQSSARPGFNADLVDGEEAYRLLNEFLALGPRCSGSEGGRKAALFISSRLADAGLSPTADEFEDATPAGTMTFRNIAATVNGNNKECIVLLSHFDTKSGISPAFSGANDSGSSTALLLHLAGLFAAAEKGMPDIVIAFVDGEECMVEYSDHDGLHGSRRLAAQLIAKYGREKVLAAIVLDMIGDRNISVTVPRNSSPALIAELFAAAKEEGMRDSFRLYNPILDDHLPFLEAGIPAVDIIDFEYGSAAGRNDYWHTEEDTIDKISAESLQAAGRITVRLINRIIKQHIKRDESAASGQP